MSVRNPDMRAKLNEARDRTTRRFGHGRTLWLSINRDPEAMAVWNGWVLEANTRAELCDRAMVAFADEVERART